MCGTPDLMLTLAAVASPLFRDPVFNISQWMSAKLPSFAVSQLLGDLKLCVFLNSVVKVAVVALCHTVLDVVRPTEDLEVWHQTYISWRQGPSESYFHLFLRVLFTESTKMV